MGIQSQHRSSSDICRTLDLPLHMDAMDCVGMRSVFGKADLEHSQGFGTTLAATVQSFAPWNNFLGELLANDPLGYM